MTNQEYILNILTGEYDIDPAVARRMYDFAYKEWHASGWYDILYGLDEIIYVVTGLHRCIENRIEDLPNG